LSSCIYFDSEYDELLYYHIDGIFFKKYLVNRELVNYFKYSDDYEIIIDFFNR